MHDDGLDGLVWAKTDFMGGVMIRRFFLGAIILLLAGTAFAQKADALDLYRKGRYAEAVAVCEQEIKVNPNNIDSYCVLCWSLIRNRQYAQAEQYALEARKKNATDIRLIESVGEARYYQGKNNGALEMFQLYVTNAPMSAGDYSWAYYYMGEIYVRQAKYEHADIAYSMAVHVNPSKALFWTRCGYAREMTSSYQSALDAYNKALELDAAQVEAVRGKERCASRLR